MRTALSTDTKLAKRQVFFSMEQDAVVRCLIRLLLNFGYTDNLTGEGGSLRVRDHSGKVVIEDQECVEGERGEQCERQHVDRGQG